MELAIIQFLMHFLPLHLKMLSLDKCEDSITCFARGDIQMTKVFMDFGNVVI